MKPRPSLLSPASLLAIATLSLALATSSHAAIYNWNTTNGDWDTLAANWSGAGSTWVNGNDAVFLNNTTASPYLINLPGTIEAASVSFGSSLAAAAKDHSYSLSGGALDVSGALIVQGKSNNGSTYTNNTTVTVNSTVVVTGDTRIGRANLTISGGTYTTNRITTNPASTDWANLTISGAGTVVTATNGIDGSYGTTGSNGSTATFAVNLNGGTLYTPYFKVADRESSGTAWLTFNGTTVKATADTANFITLYGGSQNSYISNGGAIIDTFDGTTAHDITIGVNLKNTSGQTGTLNKQGAGTLTLSGTNTYTGTTTISGGSLKVSGGSLASPTLNVGNFTYSQTAGTTNFTSSVSTSGSADGALISIAGGGFSASSLTLGRTKSYPTAPTLASAIAAATTSGLYVNGAAATVSLGSLTIGTGNSSASARIDSGSVSATGKVTVANHNNSTRWSILHVNGGTFTSSDATDGIVISPNRGTYTNNGQVYLSGGVTTAEKIAFGAATDTKGGNGFIILGGGTLYLGTGGIVKASTTSGADLYNYNIGLNSGTLGAKDNWSSSLAMTLGANPTIKAADSSETPKNIALSGNLSGGGFTKTGAGTLTLSGNNDYTGDTTVSAGTLALSGTGSIASCANIVLASAATLDVSAVTGGNWTLASSQKLTGGGGVTGSTTIEGTHNAGDAGVGSQAFSSDLTYGDGSIFEWDLNASSTTSGFDTVSAGGDIEVGTTSTIFKVVFGATALAGIQNAGNTFWNTPYVTREWSMTDIFGQAFSSGAFQSVETSADVTSYGSFTIDGSSLTWTAVPEPTSALAGLLITVGLLRRRRNA